ncbi:TetR/AcrR family transcriptional regulator [Paenibacillus gorillae]|uniref:TetR/AcrR family transcriptional regulator n=1 Tax=Paenibacillus gorillae TaxID=1243662 RepID=UPI0005A75659|nr:TetR/AcrR family transcriptional regulator [Paenibacillus gorillae]
MFDSYNKVQKAVLETTLNLIIDKELQATSISLIVKESGVSTGNLYHYFSSKEDIINELYKAILRFNGEYVTKGLNNEDDSIQTRFHRAWHNVIDLAQKYSKGFQFIEQYSFSPYIYEESKIEAFKGCWCGPLERLYQQAIDEGLFVPLKPQMMVHMNYGSIVYLLKGYQQDHLEITEDVAEQAILTCWNAVSRTKGWNE